MQSTVSNLSIGLVMKRVLKQGRVGRDRHYCREGKNCCMILRESWSIGHNRE